MEVGPVKDMEKDGEQKLDLLEEETELRLGLPGNNNSNKNDTNNIIGISGGREDQVWIIRKRGFSYISIPTLSDEIPNTDSTINQKFKESGADADPVKPPPKAQLVGWPPVRSFGKNMVAVQIESRGPKKMEKSVRGAVFVKVSMDGAPYLRKLDLKSYGSYRELLEALHDLFSPFAVNGKAMDVSNGCEYISTYEDKDGNWMLIGDVPWEMFIGSCKRLHIMKRREAIWTRSKSHAKMLQE